MFANLYAEIYFAGAYILSIESLSSAKPKAHIENI